MPSMLYELPQKVLGVIRQELDVAGVWLDGVKGVSLFAYDNKTFGLYCHTWDGCAPQEFDLHVRGEAKELRRLSDGEKPMPWTIKAMEPTGVRKIKMQSEEKETLFHVRIQPGDFVFFEVKY